MGYYGGGDGYNADGGYEEQDDYQPPQRQRRDGQGLRAYAQRVQAENAALKEQLREREEALRDLMGQAPQGAGNAPQANGSQPGGYQHPRSPMLTPEEQMQMQRMVEMGVMAAPPQGTQAEQITRMRNAQSPQELMEYLRSQGNANGTGNYQGMGY